MSDYDISKVSPRPWETNVEESDTPIRLIFDADMNCIHFDCDHDSLRHDDWHHIIHCVNMHDELVERAQYEIKPRGGAQCIEVQRGNDIRRKVWQEVLNILTRVKGERDAPAS